MNKIVLIYLLVLLSATTLVGQAPTPQKLPATAKQPVATDTTGEEMAVSKSKLIRAQALLEKQDYTNSALLLQEVIPVFEKHHASCYLGDAYFNQAFTIQPTENWAKKITLYQQAVDQFEKNCDQVKLALGLVKLGEAKMSLGKLAEGLEVLHKAYDIFLAKGYKPLHEAASLMGVAYTKMGNYKEGLKFGLIAIKAAEELKDSSQAVGPMYNYLAITYDKLGNLEQSEFYLKKALAFSKKSNDVAAIYMISSNVAHTMNRRNKPEQAIVFLKDIATTYPTPSDPFSRLQVPARLLRSYLDLKNYDSARVYMEQMSAISKTLEADNYIQVICYPLIARYYLATNQFEMAQPYVSGIKMISKKVKDKTLQATSYTMQAGIDSSRGDFAAAFTNVKTATKINDSLLNEAKTRQINQLQVEYETEKKDKDILLQQQNLKLQEQDIDLLTRQAMVQRLLNHKNEQDLVLKQNNIEFLTNQQQLQTEEAIRRDRDSKLKDQDIRIKNQSIALLEKKDQLRRSEVNAAQQQRNIIIMGAVALTLLLILLYSRYRMKQRTNRQLETQQREINEKNSMLETLLSEKDKLIEEKEWLLREVHHRVKNNLQMVISLLDTQSSFMSNDSAIKAIQDSQHRMQAISLIHQKLYQTAHLSTIDMPMYIQELIGYLCESYEGDLRIRVEQDIDPVKLDVAQAIPVGLILNEAITNSMKYAFSYRKDGRIHVTMKATPEGEIFLECADDGFGFPSEMNVSDSKTLGLRLMQGLSEQLSGRLEIGTENGAYVRVRFMPVNIVQESRKDDKYGLQIVSYA
jgi:two-component sensor histidine kinase